MYIELHHATADDVCGSDLIPDDVPPHCEDCRLDDEYAEGDGDD